MLFLPFGDHRRQEWDPRAEHVGQPGGLQSDLVGFRDHPGVGDDGDIGELMGFLERGDDRQHGRGFGLVTLERFDHQRHPRSVGEQPESDLRLQSAFLGKPRLAEPVAGVGLEVQGADIEEHQASRPELSVRGTRR